MNNTEQTANTEQLADNYIATWNETDEGKRRELLAQLWTPTGTYLDPLMQGQGIDHISALIQAAQQQFAGLHFVRAGKTDQVGDCVRFSWHLTPAGTEAQPVAGGTDFCVLDEAGRLQSVTGFIDFAPVSAP